MELLGQQVRATKYWCVGLVTGPIQIGNTYLNPHMRLNCACWWSLVISMVCLRRLASSSPPELQNKNMYYYCSYRNIKLLHTKGLIDMERPNNSNLYTTKDQHFNPALRESGTSVMIQSRREGQNQIHPPSVALLLIQNEIVPLLYVLLELIQLPLATAINRRWY